MSTSFFTKGINSTLMLNKGTNLSYQSTGLAIYTSTEIDRWPLSEFVSAEYIINAEFGKNERETIHATLVAMPGQTAITIYGRTNLSRPLLSVRSNATNSYAQLIVEPASLDVQGSIISFFGNYARSATALVPLNAPAIANSAAWSAVTDATTLTITIPTDKVSGAILVGQLVANSLLPSTASVTSWNSATGTLVISWLTATSIPAATVQQIAFTTAPGEPVNNTSIIQATQNFKSIETQGQVTVKATQPADTLRLIGNSGIVITTDSARKEITFTSQAFNSITVAGQSSLNTAITDSPVLNLVSGTGITMTTDSSINQLTIASRAPTLTTDDALSLTGFNLRIAGGTGITTAVANGKITISTTAAVNSYTSFTDANGKTATAGSQNSAFNFRAGAGVSVAVEDNHATYGDNLLITNTGVTSIAGLTGAVLVDALVAAINTSTGSVNLPIGSTTPNIGAFTTLTASGISTFTTLLEQATIVASAAPTVLNFDVLTSSVIYYTISATTNMQINFRGNSTTTLDSIMNIGRALTVAFINTNGAPAFYPSSHTIDGASITPKWQGGTAPTSGNASSLDVFSYTIIKTAGGTFTLIASQTRFA